MIDFLCNILSILSAPVAGFRWSKRDIAEGYYANINHPSKQFILDNIVKLNPQKNILEVGCASGGHVTLLAKRLPGSYIHGLDINKKAVRYGNLQLNSQNIENARLVEGKADALVSFANDSIDIVFTVAVLTHIPPNKIRKVLQELSRVSSRWIVLVEPQLDEHEKTHLLKYHYFQWLRDYIKLIKEMELGQIGEVTKIPVELWNSEPWKSLGKIIIIQKRFDNK
jgi:ubiquinone/menaquinone biosynthesis C-methylase UbiE